ncbi:hypothetical protein STCU_01207 [Strigomonas culicis]|uniref:Uncharacterized protein n=1 Tax=Strigomonas culicis TaxID=28005 RepID=S9W7I6_9TRYP|nr:hypothetical protein STCU_01207 [Strigomonas culicis]|eukprot:EPY35186.1 hypothetical protein STCU_01207 [Strigomonas culicis]
MVAMKWSVKEEVVFSAQDIARLEVAVDQVENETAISKLEELVNTVVPLSCVAEKLLQKFMHAANEEDHRELDDLAKRYHALPALLTSVSRAGDALYTRLKGMLLKEPDALLAGVPRFLPRSFFRYMAATLYIQSVVLPDYHLHRTENTDEHVRALVRARNLLQWSENIQNENFFNWTSSVCHRAFEGVASAHWVKFCESSLTSPTVTEIRTAAVLEELIALDSSYAPFRIHYASTLSLLDSPKVDRTTALSVIRRQKESLTKRQYKQVEPFYIALLDILEAFVTPLNLIEYELTQRVERAMIHLNSCSRLREPFSQGNTSIVWPGRRALKGEARAPLFLVEQVNLVADKLSLVFSDDQRASLERLRTVRRKEHRFQL